jgi:preprotein translocase subunit SecB
MAEQQPAVDKQLAISKIYVKDFSFESPQSPEIFKNTDWKPQTNLNLRSSHTAVEGNVHEVVLTITIEAKDGDKALFLVELQQAGLFEIAGYEGEELSAIVGSLIQKGGFPEFVLQPINFDALYMQSKQQQAEKAAAGEAH